MSRILWAVAIFLISGAASANAGTFTVFGPQNYARGTGAPVTVTSNFSVLNPNTQYTLKVFNGGLQDNQAELVSSGFVTINGVQVIGPSNFNQNVVEADVPVTLQATNTIDVQVRGKPGGVLTVEIVGVDNDPPVINITSPANGVTVSTSPVLVAGTVSDALSGVAAVTCNGAPATLQSGSFSCSVALTSGSNIITVSATDAAGNTSTATDNVTFSNAAAPTISSFSPTSGPIGTEITLTGTNFTANGTATPKIALSLQGGGSINAPVASFTATNISFVIPAGATSGAVTVTAGTQSAVSAASLSVVASSGFTVSAGPSSASVQQGTSTAYSVTLNSSNGFSQLASLSVTGVPTGVTTKFSPSQITAGQSSILTVTAPAGQTLGNATLVISASATVDGIPTTQSANVSLAVQAATTSLIGRTVESDNNETPIPGITITMLGVDDAGNHTGCSGQTRSDAAGNFALTNMGTSCLGRQLVAYDGNTATDGETYAGVNLAYTMIAGQVTGPELVHMPTISDAETIMVKQNASVDQVFSYSTIPGVTVTVYAGTTLTLPSGGQPDPFPMAAVLVPVDRLPDAPSPTAGTLRASIVAFQPANTTSSLPVSVTFPNVVNTPPGVNMELDTLDPIVGELVKYGTGTVSADATEIVPDQDPAHPGHRFGISHFDWHGPMAPGPNGNNPCPSPPCQKGGDPVDLSSGLLTFTKTDIAFGGARGQVSIERTYRTLSGSPGPFGIGTNHNYGYELDVSNLLRGTGTFVTLVMPDGNQLQFVQQGTSIFVNSTVPNLLGAVITSPGTGIYNLRWKNGTVYNFQTSNQGALLAFLNSITDGNGNTTTLVRNPSQPSQITQVIDPVGRALNISYDSFNRILSLTDPIGRTVQYTYNVQGTLATVTDAAGGVTTYAYDTQNRMSSITDARGIKYLQNTYDANGRVIQQTAADGGVTTFAYTLLNPTLSTSPVLLTTVTDPLGNTTTYHFTPQGFLVDVTDALGGKIVYIRDPGNNQILSSTDSLGRTRAYTHDTAGNTTSVTFSPSSILIASTYDPTSSHATSVTDPLSHTTSFSYDHSGNVVANTDPLGNQTTFAYDGLGEPAKLTDAMGNTIRFEFDTFGNLQKVTDSLGRTSTRVTDAVARPLSATNPLGQTTTFQYNALDQVVKTVDAAGTTTSFTYDPNGNLLSLTDALGHVTKYTYDSMDRVAVRTDPLGNAEHYQYDLAGNLAQFTDRRGKSTTYAYDSLNRRIFAGFGTQPGPTYESTIRYSYDAVGRLIEITDSIAGTIKRTFDSLDRLSSETTPQGTISYTYDTAGRRTSMLVAGQPSLDYSYDDANHLLQLTQSGQTVSFTYDTLGRRSAATFPNGVSVNYSYDGASQLTAITYQHGSSLLGNLTYIYDNAGRRVSVGGSLAQTNLPGAIPSATYDAANKLVAWNGMSFSYDNEGNMLFDGTHTFTWDARGQLATVGGVTLQYDAFGRRTQNLSGQQFLYDGPNVVQELGNGGATANMVTGGVDEVLWRTDSAGTFFPLGDALGSTVAQADANGSLTTKQSYDPFGATSISGQSNTNVFQYTGRENDDNGIYYYRHRYYSPQFGRFLSQDPSGFSGGLNLYSYAKDSPMNSSDPSGLWGTKAHNQIIWNALHPCGVSNEDIWQIQQGSESADALQYQAPKYSFMHMMSDGTTNQSAADVHQLAAQFTASNMQVATSQYAAGANNQAMYSFGFAMHPLMDVTSPAHTDANGNPLAWCGLTGWCSDRRLHGDDGFPWTSIEGVKTLNQHPEVQELENFIIRNFFQEMTGRKLHCN